MSLRLFARDKHGTVAVIFGLLSVPLLGLVGAAMDYSQATQARSTLQAAADSAALVGVLRSGTASERTLAVTAAFNARTQPALAASPSVQVSNDKVVVTASGHVETTLLKVLNLPTIDVGVRATAVRAQNGPPPCILALSKAATPGIEISGNATLQSKGCVLYSNSSSKPSIQISGSANVAADGYCAAGTVVTTRTLTPSPQDYCPEATDPYASLRAPSDTVCRWTNASVQPKESKTLDPGVYCGGLDLKGDVTLSPGLYVIKDGLLSMNSQGTISGKGVTFYLMGANAGFSINGGAKLELSPMTTGAYSGLLLVQDRQSNINGVSKFNGNGNTLLSGLVYMPTQQVQLNGTASFSQVVPFFPIIADTIKITGSMASTADATSMNLIAPLPQSPGGARLLE